MWLHRPATTVVDEQGVHTRPFSTEHGRLTSLLGLDPATATELGRRLSSWRTQQDHEPPTHR